MKKFEEYLQKSEPQKPVEKTIGMCYNCGQEAKEGKPDKDGMWHYRCTNCGENYDPHYIFKDTIPCPKCGCTNHEQTCSASNMLQYEHPLKPQIVKLTCLNCSYEFPLPDFEKYMLGKNILNLKEQDLTKMR